MAEAMAVSEDVRAGTPGDEAALDAEELDIIEEALAYDIMLVQSDAY